MINSEPNLTAAEEISASALLAYLLRTGWTAAPSRVGGVSILSKQVTGAVEPISFILPVTQGFDEEHRRVADALRAIEVVEHRPIGAIVREVRQSFQTMVGSELANYATSDEVFRLGREIAELQSRLSRLSEAFPLRSAALAEELDEVEESDEVEVEESDDVEDSSKTAPDFAFNPALLKKVDDLELTLGTRRSLKRDDSIVYVGDLVHRTEAQILRTPNFGRRALNEIKEVLAQMGLHLGMEVPGWPPENIQQLANFEDHY